MIGQKAIRSLEFDKVREKLASYCVLRGGKDFVLSGLMPADSFEQATIGLKRTEEAFGLLYYGGVSGIEYFDPLGDIVDRAEKGATLSMKELLMVAALLRSARILYRSVADSDADKYPLLHSAASGLYFDQYLENEIKEKILSEDTMSDNASEKLAAIRRSIKRINEQIREKLSSFLRDGGKYLQENIITMRGNRYVLPVKSEFKNQINGFVHDQSATGSTVFIEPAAVLDLNNQLRTANIEEQVEIERILQDLSVKVASIARVLRTDEQILTDFDAVYAKAIYAYKTKSVMPELNGNGYVDVINGRHPLIDPKKVIPVSLRFGRDYNYLLITGPNTGGKTVTLKMTGLLCVMAMSGMFVPADIGTKLSFFEKVFCDVGDEQSIEQSLSTFSSHIKNITEIVSEVNESSLVLIDEIGAGTDPEEGSALAQAIIEKLTGANSRGIVTTHYSSLKEYAYSEKKIMNASMEFNAETFEPLYKINIGMPGSSNAIEISRILGLDEEIIERAYSFMSGNKIAFEQILREAERSRQQAAEVTDSLSEIKAREEEKLKEIEAEKKRLESEKEKLFTKAKAESRRLVNEKVEEADEIIEEIKILFDKAEIDSGDLIKARTLRNRLEEKKYTLDEPELSVTNYKPVDCDDIKPGDSVYYKPMDAVAKVNSVNPKKKECEIFIGSLRLKTDIKNVFFVSKKTTPGKQTVSLKRDMNSRPLTEINVIGENAEDALLEIGHFIDQAVVNNLEEVKIIHGKGMKILSKVIQDYLRRDKRVESFRFGKYGEGEHGVTFAKLK